MLDLRRASSLAWHLQLGRLPIRKFRGEFRLPSFGVSPQYKGPFFGSE